MVNRMTTIGHGVSDFDSVLASFLCSPVELSAMSAGKDQKSDLYLKRASGLVKVAGPWSGFAFNIIWTGNAIGNTAAFVMWLMLFTSPGENLVGLIVAATLLSVMNCAVYMLFSMAIPRSGGDYHFIGRTLHPALGFMSSVNWAIWLPYVVGFWGTQVAVIFFGSLLKAFGVATNNPGLIQLASSSLDPNTTFILGAIVITAFTVITLFGNKVYFTFQNVSFVLMIVAMIITFAAFLMNTPATFAAAIDKSLGANTYQGTIQAFQATNPNLRRAALVAIPSGIVAWAGVNTWSMGTSLIAGEVKNERSIRTWLIGNIFSALVVGALFALTVYLYMNSVGSDFVYAMTYLSGTPDYKLVFAPYYGSFIPFAFPNLFIFIIFAVGYFLGGLFFFPQNQILSSRIMLAWSFDRLMPGKLGYVDKRYHVPVVATIAVLGIALISLWVTTYTTWLSFFSQLFAVAFSFLLTSIAAIIFPYRRKHIFDSAPQAVRIRVGGIPLMSILGVANAIFMLVFIYQNWTDAALLSNSPQSVGLIVGILVASFILYYVIRAIRKRQGIDIDALYKEIPPE